MASRYLALAEDPAASPGLREAARLLTQAEASLQAEAARDALDHATAALALLREGKDKEGVADALSISAEAQCSLNQRKEADQLLRGELALCRASMDKMGEAKLLLAVAKVNLEGRGARRREEAIELAAHSRSMLRQMGEARLEGRAVLVSMEAQLSVKGAKYQSAQAALSLAEEGAELFGRAGDRRGEAMVWYWRAEAHLQLRQFKDATHAAQQARDLFHDAKDRLMEARALQRVASHNLAEGNPREAIPAAEAALGILRELPGQQLAREQAALEAAFQAHIANRDPERGLFLAEEGVARFKKLREKGQQLQALLLVSQGYMSLEGAARAEVPQEAMAAAQQALALALELGEVGQEARVASLVTSLKVRQQDYEESIRLARGGRLQEELDELESKAVVTDALIRGYMARGEHAEAAAAARRAQEAFHQLGDSKGEAAVLLTLSTVHFELQHVDDAVNSARQAASLYALVQDRAGEAGAMQLMAEQRHANYEHERALHASTRALSYVQRQADKPGELRMRLLIAQNRVLLLAKKTMVEDADARMPPAWEELAKAHQAAKEVLAFANEMGEQRSIASALIINAQMLMFNNRIPDATQMTDEAMALYCDLGDTLSEASARLILSRLYLLSRSLDKSLRSAKDALELFRDCDDARGEALAEALLNQLRDFEFRVDEVDEAGGAGRQRALPAASGAVAAVAAAAPRVDPSFVRDAVQEITKRMVGSTDIVEADLPLMDIGITSMNAVLFRNKLGDRFEGVDLPSTLVFDYPTLREMVGIILDRAK